MWRRLALLWAATGLAARADWPTLHGDLQRSGFYESFPTGNLELAWRKDLAVELTAPRAEIIVSSGLALMGSYAGIVRAWDVKSGEEKWKANCGGAIGHSVGVDSRRVFVASLAGLTVLDKATGRELKRLLELGALWTAPCVSEGLVFVGNRNGEFFAIDAANFTILWRLKTGGPVLTPSSVSADGKWVVIASEDMRVRCCNAVTGHLRWTSSKLPGLSLRDYAPCLAGGLVLVATNPVKDFHTILGENEQMLVKRAGFTGKDTRYIDGTDDDVEREQDAIVAHFKAHADEQCFHALRLTDGAAPWVAPILYAGGCHNPLPPPCFNRKTGETYVQLRSAYGVWDGGGEVRSYTGFGLLDLATGRVKLLRHSHASKEEGRPPGAKDYPWSSFNYIGDETQVLSCAPGWLFSNHQGFIGSLNLETGKLESKWGKRDTYGGFFGPGTWGWEGKGGMEKAAAAGQPFALVNEWHGPARSIASVSDGMVYYHSGGQIIALKSINVKP